MLHSTPATLALFERLDGGDCFAAYRAVAGVSRPAGRPGRGVWLTARVGQDELLNALAVLHFTGVDVSLGIGGDRVDPMQLAGVAAVAAERTRQGAILAVENPNHVVGAVGGQHVFLLRVARQGEVIDRPARRILQIPNAAAVRTARLRRRMHEPTGHELSLLGEDLNAVAAALADVNQTVA